MQLALDGFEARFDMALKSHEIMGYGISGVRSFRRDDSITSGQDRLWVIEEALKSLSKSPSR